MPMFAPLLTLSRQLAESRIKARALIEAALQRIDDPAGEGKLAFLTVNRAAAMDDADHYDTERAKGRAMPPFAGIPIAVKDLFDVAGEVTRVGSKLLNGAPVAARDATAVARLKAQGFIVLGRTNMTEFAYSGVGLNPHYGTPRSPYDRATGRIPGGPTGRAASGGDHPRPGVRLGKLPLRGDQTAP